MQVHKGMPDTPFAQSPQIAQHKQLQLILKVTAEAKKPKQLLQPTPRMPGWHTMGSTVHLI